MAEPAEELAPLPRFFSNYYHFAHMVGQMTCRTVVAVEHSRRHEYNMRRRFRRFTTVSALAMNASGDDLMGKSTSSMPLRAYVKVFVPQLGYPADRIDPKPRLICA